MEFQKQDRRDSPLDIVMRSVTPPVRHEGVGNALRVAFIPRACEIPGDWAMLLAKLA